MGKVIDLAGQRFERLEVIEFAGYTNANKAKWLCKCDCGNYKEVIGSNLRNGKTKSCGCYCHERIVERNTKHGLEGKKICHVLRNIKSRCLNKNNKYYKYYGGRGITICSEWLGENGLKKFADWAYANGYDENAEYGQCTIDRIDVNGNYEPSNCRWVNLTIQANNKTSNVIIEYMGEKDTLENWCKRFNLSRSMIRHRLERGCEIEKLFDNPKRKPILITYNGETKSLKELSKITGIKYKTLYSRFNSGWDIEKIFQKVKN